MKYHNHPHPSSGRSGILLTNLGTPDAPTTAAVRRYLAEFLWDPRVVEVPRPLWWLLLHGIILRTRPRRSAHAYRQVWQAQGSPLLTTTQRLGERLQQRLNQQQGAASAPLVVVAMRYGNPSIEEGLNRLDAAGVERLLVLPLYPQYAAATTASTYDALYQVLRRWRRLPELRWINHYASEPHYIAALADSVLRHQQQHGQPERLLISFHGIPQRYADGGDPYPRHCEESAHALATALGLTPQQWQLSYQSRFGREEWLRPYTDETLKSWGAEGVSHTQVICPGFAVDCLETLEEIGEENRDSFLHSGGKTFSYIPALNDHDSHLELLTTLVNRHTQGWG